jgi:hypothetical protein
MSDTADDVAGRLDGTTPVAPNQTVVFDGENVPVWRPVTLYRTVTDSQDRNVPRTNLPAAQPWNTPSTLDQATVLAEDLTIVYQDPTGGQWTLSDMIIELFKAHLGLPTKAAGA